MENLYLMKEFCLWIRTFWMYSFLLIDKFNLSLLVVSNFYKLYTTLIFYQPQSRVHTNSIARNGQNYFDTKHYCRIDIFIFSYC